MHGAGFAPKRDNNEPEIVRALEVVGASVQRLSVLGCPDLLVGFRGQTFLFEVKNGKAKLNPNQVLWWQNWNGGLLHTVRSCEDALRLIGLQLVSPGLYMDDGIAKTYPRPKER